MQSKIINILNRNFKNPISCLATYSSAIAKILDGNIDMILVGDSLGSNLYGMKNTQGVTLDMMKRHGKAVIKNIKKSITVVDMPFKTYENKNHALKNAKDIINYTKADLIKLEVNKNKIPIIEYLSEKRINLIAHIGVTPQSYKDFSKIRSVGKSTLERKKLIELAIQLEKSGAKAILLECVSRKTAKLISSSIKIPTIGIGASEYCDGQVLVFDDLINLNINHTKPRFVKNYLDFTKISKDAVENYNRDVKNRKFPSKKYSYS